MLFGAHCSTAGGIWTALERCKEIGGDACQVFVKNNMQWSGREHSPEAVTRFTALRHELRIRHVFAHSGYLINIAAPPSVNRDKSLESLILELRLASALNLPFLVLHPGAHLGTGEETGIKNATAALDEVFAATKSSPVMVALENTAGQGSCLGHRLLHLACVIEHARHPERLGICLDSAHLFAAGYDIRTLAGWNKVIREMETLVGHKRILAFHLNDSKTDLGSRVDRHAHIGQGKIGLAGFRAIVNDTRFKHHPACIETPKSDDLHEDKRNLAVLRSLIRKTKKAAARQKAAPLGPLPHC